MLGAWVVAFTGLAAWIVLIDRTPPGQAGTRRAGFYVSLTGG